MPTPSGDTFLYNILQSEIQQQEHTTFHLSPNQIELKPTRPSFGEPDHTEPSRQISQVNTEEQRTDTSAGLIAPGRPQPLSTAGLDEEEPQPLPSPLNLGIESDDSQMGRKSQKPSLQEPDRPSSTSSGGQNNHANGNMDSHLEMRRKHASLESPTAASQTAHLMSRESFTLDNEPPQTPITPNPNSSFFDLPRQDRRNFLLLVLLYFLQGIPMGLASGSVPFLLKQHLSYGQIGVFTLASYPYSLKLLWSPIVDAVWSPRLGRRKSWILPIQVCSGIGMIYLGGRVKEMMVAAGASDGSGVWSFTWWWFFLVFLCATQDIAVDGWALTLLSPQNLSYASTAQTVGLTGGHFLSYTVFLAFNSPDFANRWFRSTPSTEGVMTLGGYVTFWGWGYLLVTLGLAILKKEDKTKEKDGILEVYRSMLGILRLRNIQSIIIIHLIAKIGFQANDAVTNLKLVDKGFSQEDLALTVLIDFPFEISLGYYAGRWSTSNPPIHVWCWAFIGRLVAACMAQLTVMIFPTNGVQPWYLLTVIASHIFSTFTNTVMFVAISAFHAKIADPAIGGTYMTLLATYAPPVSSRIFPEPTANGLSVSRTSAVHSPASSFSSLSTTSPSQLAIYPIRLRQRKSSKGPSLQRRSTVLRKQRSTVVLMVAAHAIFREMDTTLPMSFA